VRGKFLTQSPRGKFLGTGILTKLSAGKFLACEIWIEYARMIFLYLYRSPLESPLGFLILDPSFPIGMIFFPLGKEWWEGSPGNLAEKRLVGPPTCGGFCDRSTSFLGSSRSPCHPSQFLVFSISSMSLFTLPCFSFLAILPL
jgi:hypothetical protein